MWMAERTSQSETRTIPSPDRPTTELSLQEQMFSSFFALVAFFSTTVLLFSETVPFREIILSLFQLYGSYVGERQS